MCTYFKHIQKSVGELVHQVFRTRYNKMNHKNVSDMKFFLIFVFLIICLEQMKNTGKTH